MRLVFPWPKDKKVNAGSPYGMRKNPVTGVYKKHRGVDVGGTFPVTSAGEGIVTKVSYNGNKRSGGGHVVIIKHATNLFTVYYHGAQATKLKVGDRVKAGDFIYTSGSTGASTGPHLHFEVRTGSTGAWGTDTDPMPYFSGSAITQTMIKVDGRLDRTTWSAWQTALQKAGHDPGIIDGRPGSRTYMAIARWVGVKPTGVLSVALKKAVQKKLGVVADGVWGKGTISALQRKLNEGAI